MLAFFRDGFLKDLIFLLLITIIIGTLFSQGIALAIDNYFGDTLDDLIGEYGEYDLVLHIREEAKEAALRELERIGNSSFPGFKVKQTLTIAGQANFFFGLPKEFRTKEILEGISSYFGAVPGLNGYSLMVEPSVLIRGVHPSVREELIDKLDTVSGVLFSVKDANNLVVVLKPDVDSQGVASEIQTILADYQILELRFPMGFEVETEQLAGEVIRLLEQEHATEANYENVTSVQYGEDLDAFLKTLGEMRDFLKSYASQVKLTLIPEEHLSVGELVSISDNEVILEVTAVFGDLVEAMIVEGAVLQSRDKLVEKAYKYLGPKENGAYVGEVEIVNERSRLLYAIEESLRLLGELEELSVQASEAVVNADAVLNTFQEALLQLEVLQVQLRQLTEGLGPDGSGEQFLVNLLLNGLFQSLLQTALANDLEDASVEDFILDGSFTSFEQLDLDRMRTSLEGIADQISNVQEIDVTAIVDQIAFVRDTLPDLNDAEIGQSIRLINTYLAGQVIPGERVQILVRGMQVDEKKFEKLLRTDLSNPYAHLYSTSVGMINPDTRGEIFRVLKEVRAIVAGLLAIVFTLIVLILDHATVFSAIKELGGSKKRTLYSLLVFGGGLGTLLLGSVFYFSKAELPFFGLKSILVLGFLLGILSVLLSEKFSPVDPMEILAGKSLGLSNVQIMREIVIPQSRPGLLNILNRPKQVF